MESYSKDPQSEVSSVVKEIMSLQSERRELLASFTPLVSVWKHIDHHQDVHAHFFGGNNHAVDGPVQEMETELASTDGQLGRYFDSILQDMEDLFHRVLSMEDVLVKPTGAAPSSYMAAELVNSTSRLTDACTELFEHTNDADDEPAVGLGEPVPGGGGEVLSEILKQLVVRDYSERPWENQLALVLTSDEFEGYKKTIEEDNKRVEEAIKEGMALQEQWNKTQKEMKEMKKKGMLKQFQLQQRQLEKERQAKKKADAPATNTMEYLKKRMDDAEKFFADNREAWTTTWGSKSTKCGHFEDKTLLSPMHFTHYTADTISSSCGVTGKTLEILSMKIVLKDGLKWPLKLYGVVAARDTVDRNRNIVFSRSSDGYQVLDENDYLGLNGPSRAIVALDYVDFEVQLEILEGKKSQAKELITISKRWWSGTSLLVFENKLCRAELKLEQLSEAVQATIVGVRVDGGEWPFEYGCKVACSLAATDAEFVFLDCLADGKDDEVRVGSDGCLRLLRNVVSVPSKGKLIVSIASYLKGVKSVYQSGNVVFQAQKCQTSEGECKIGNSKVKVVVAWSLLVNEKRDLLVDWPAGEP